MSHVAGRDLVAQPCGLECALVLFSCFGVREMQSL